MVISSAWAKFSPVIATTTVMADDSLRKLQTVSCAPGPPPLWPYIGPDAQL